MSDRDDRPLEAAPPAVSVAPLAQRTTTDDVRPPRPAIVAPGEGERLNVLGDGHTVKVSAENSGGVLTLIEIDSLPGAGFQPHRRDRESATFYVLDGTLEFVLGERSISAGAGSVIHVPRGTVHGWKS